MNVCDNCGDTVEATDNYCGNCGERNREECHACRQPLTENTRLNARDIDTGAEMFRATDDLFDAWYADGYGIQPSFDPRGYEDMDVERAKEKATELLELALFCEQVQDKFGDL